MTRLGPLRSYSIPYHPIHSSFSSRDLPQRELVLYLHARHSRTSFLSLAETRRTRAKLEMVMSSWCIASIQSTMTTYSWCVGAFYYQFGRFDDA